MIARPIRRQLRSQACWCSRKGHLPLEEQCRAWEGPVFHLLTHLFVEP